ncbi:hypothetical protein JXD38_03955, partial [candidate division WOR-3 bacterium]|nr:hypothetical protein [candidate division WOR-3 bacterium]
SSWLDFTVSGARDSSTSARADLDWTYSNAHQYRFGVAPVDGQVLGFHTDVQSRSLFSDKDLARALAYWYGYLGHAPQTWSLRAKLAVGTAFEQDAADAFMLDNEPGLLGVRGYAEASGLERSVIAAGLQFRTPLWWVERGIGTGPLFLQNINAALFADFGLTSPNLQSEIYNLQSAMSRARLGVGAELRADLIVAHLLPVSIHGGCGFGLNPLWSYQPYFGISSSVLSGILNSPVANRQSLRASAIFLKPARRRPAP